MKQIDVSKLKIMKDNDEEFILLDVREKNEVDYANISPHINISIGEITERHQELDKNKIWKEKYSALSLGKITALTSTDKAEYIKLYIDAVTKLMIKHKEAIKKEFGQAITDNDGFWNEMVVSQIKVKDALILSDSVPMKFVWKDHPEHDTVDWYEDTHGVRFISKEKIINHVKKATTGKVIWGKVTDMPGFINKRGGNPYEPKISIGVVK